MKYQVRITTAKGSSYMSHLGRDSWSLCTAKKHAQDIVKGKTGIQEWLSVAVVDELGIVVRQY